MANHRHHERPGPVQTSAVYLVSRPTGPVERPPSPPSPGALQFCSPALAEIPELDDIISTTGIASSPAIVSAAAALQSPASPAVTAPPSPSSRPADPKTLPALPLQPSLLASQTSQEFRHETFVESRLASAVSVLNAEAVALASLARMYSNDAAARMAFDQAAGVITASQRARMCRGGGTLVVSGVGKSGHIARKLAATFSSLSVRAAFMHPTEALHGDLGLLAPGRDVALLVSFSGRTPELCAMASHLHPSLPVIILTAAPDGECEIAALLRTMRAGPVSGKRGCVSRPGLGSRGSSAFSSAATSGEDANEFDRDSASESGSRAWTEWSRSEECGDDEHHGAPVVVLPAPIPVSEVESLGIAAPTASTTVALALGDALAVVAGRELHGGVEGMASVFARNHPGGAIGATIAASRGMSPPVRFDDSRPATPG